MQPSAGTYRSMLSKGWDFLCDLVYPPHCAVCGRLGAWFCADCTQGIVPVSPPLCRHCGKTVAREGLCWNCQEGHSRLAGMRSAGLHLPPLQQAIHAFKYEGMRVLAEPLGAVMADAWRRDPLPASTIMPVPLHPKRLRQRGYNQSLLLARILGERIGLPLREGLLIRARNTRAQVGLGQEERLINVSEAFRCPGGTLQGERVLLVDDVLTTGATLESCAGVLLDAGAAEVWALTLSRAVGSSAGDKS